jgi:hypothetical protein
VGFSTMTTKDRRLEGCIYTTTPLTWNRSRSNIPHCSPRCEINRYTMLGFNHLISSTVVDHCPDIVLELFCPPVAGELA